MQLRIMAFVFAVFGVITAVFAGIVALMVSGAEMSLHVVTASALRGAIVGAWACTLLTAAGPVLMWRWPGAAGFCLLAGGLGLLVSVHYLAIPAVGFFAVATGFLWWDRRRRAAGTRPFGQ